MRHYARNPVSLLAIVVALAIASPAPAAADDTGKIDGRWRAVEMESGGKRVKPPTPQATAATIVIGEGKYRAYLGDKLLIEFTLTLDPAAKPKTYEMKSDQPDRKGRTPINRGIYEIDAKGQLRMCFTTGEDAKPPKSFDTKQTPGSQLTIYERVK